jgi:cytochrome c oxidase subunit II
VPDTTTAAVDNAFIYIMAFAVLLLALIVFLLVYLPVRYHRSRNPVAEPTRPHPFLEAAWILAALLLAMSMFYSGLVGFRFLRRPPSDAMRVTVIARQWSWLFQYENGLKSEVLVVPQGEPVNLALRSQDVIHGFYVPAFRIKQDVVPGMTTRAWFTAADQGSFDVLCSQYCGLEHSQMRSQVVVVAPEDFRRWYAGETVSIPGVTALEEPTEGPGLLRLKGCLDCHSLDGSERVGPTFKGLYGSRVQVITSGKKRTVTADEEYLRRSILDPDADAVTGFRLSMPQEKGNLSEKEIGEIIKTIKGLSRGP